MIDMKTAIEIGIEAVKFIKLEKMDVTCNNSESYNIELSKDEKGRIQFTATVSFNDISDHIISILYEYGVGIESYDDISDFFNILIERFG